MPFTVLLSGQEMNSTRHLNRYIQCTSVLSLLDKSAKSLKGQIVEVAMPLCFLLSFIYRKKIKTSVTISHLI